MKMGWRDRRWLRRTTIVVGVLVVIVVAVRVFLDPIAGAVTRRQLAKAKGMRGDFERVHVTLFPPGYAIRRLKIIEHPGGSWKAPLFYAENVAVSLRWRRLLHRELAASARLDEPKIIVSRRKAEPKEEKPLPDLGAILEEAIPARVDRIEVRDGEIVVRDWTGPRKVELWVHSLEIAAENLATRRELAGGRPATVAARGALGRSGELALFVSANPLAHQPDFAGRASIRGWRVAELYDLVEPATKLQTPEGTLDVFAEFRARDGVIRGGVKPVLKGVRVRPAEDGLGTKLKAWLADKSLRLFSDRVPGREAVATTIPIEGRLDQPDIQLMPTVLGVVRNAFVTGVSSGFVNLPPEKSAEKQGPVKQTVKALEKKEGPPKAQPGQDEER